ncbi:MAG: T9SS type A sorting domain-containing protein [Bacteroidales bacterium]|nr:T9SS type A sorting domain-containing protein [Bacteroidales bacterium]
MEGINNTAIPTYLLDWMDTVYAPGQLHGTYTRLYGESSFDTLQITGDYIVVNLKESTVLSYGAFDFYNMGVTILNRFVLDQLEHSSVFTLFTQKPISDFRYKNYLIRNITKSYGGFNPGDGKNYGDITIQCVGQGNISTNPTNIITHEISHSLFGGNEFHTSGGNHRFVDNTKMVFPNIQGGFGLMGAANSGLVGCNGYERWRMHWKHPQAVDYIAARNTSNSQSVVSDITREDGNKTFLLRDFVTYGDAVRIKLPYKDSVTSSNQYIWLENHQVGSNGKLDFLQYSNTEVCRPQGAAGIYAYYQIGRDVIEGPSDIVWDKSHRDNLKAIPSEGYHDYRLVPDTYNIACVAYSQPEQAVVRGAANPLCGGHDQEKMLFPEEGDSVLYVTREVEPCRIVKNGQNYDNLPFLGDNYDAFSTHTKINMGTNPSTNNAKTCHSRNYSDGIIHAEVAEKNVRTTYLTGLGIEMTPVPGTGNILVSIRWDDYDITNDCRWTGKIALKDTAVLTMGKTITLAQNRTVAQTTRDAETGLFAGRTRWTCEAGSYLRQDSASAIVLTENSSLVFEGGSRFEQATDASMEVGAGCTLRFSEDADIVLRGSLEIDSGGICYMVDTVGLCTSARIIVRPGGKLVVDGGTLTSASTGEMWQGIVVLGDRTQHQTASKQGTVELKNGAVVENARCGIKTGPADILDSLIIDINSTGGIILAQDATFRNCARAVYMGPYTDYTPSTGILKPNASSFTRCTFTLDNDNLIENYGARFSEHTRLWGVAGVRFAGCTFNNTSSIDSRGCGIRAEDAGFRVDTYCSQEMMNSDCTCPGQYATHSTFSGFSTAVSVSTTGSPFAVTVDEASFSNNGTGISVSGNNHATVTRCQFDLSLSPELPYSAIGLSLSACTGFLVEGNAFSRSSSSFPTYGIKAVGTGISNNSLYRNTFSGLTYGIYSSGNNGGSFSGLRFSCNTFSQNTHDIYVTSGQVAETQGSASAGADNSFSSGATGNLEVVNPKCWLDYYYSTGGSHSPTVHTSNVLLHPNALANGCASTLCTGGGVIKGLMEYQALSNSIDGVSADNYDADGRTDRIAVLQEMSDITSENIRGIEGGDTIDVVILKDWFSAISETWAKYSLAETEYFSDEDNTPTLLGIPALLTTTEERDEYDNYMAFNALKESLSGHLYGHANWPVATEGQIAELQRIAEAGTGRSSVMARGVLCFFFNICYDDEEVMAQTRRAAAKDGEGYMPVLTNDTVTFSIASRMTLFINDNDYDPYYLGAESFPYSGCPSDTAVYNNTKYRLFQTPIGYNMYVREDTSTGRIFRYYPASDIEVMTCDMSLQEGDTFYFPFSPDFWYYEFEENGSVVVDSVTYSNGRKVIWFPTVSDGSFFGLDMNSSYPLCFIEGVGPTYGPFGYVQVSLENWLGLLLCVHHNDSLVYMADPVLGCEQYLVSVPEYPDVSMKLYPNPAGNTLHVEFEGADDPQGTLSVTDITGVAVLTRECHEPVTQLDVSNLTPGLYVVSFRNEKGVVVRKFVKM